MGIFKAVGGALNQLSEFLTTAERGRLRKREK
jgi:hypothetical protein